MRAGRFEDVLVWQKSKVMVLEMYRDFGSCRDYSFKDQILRAAVSIMNNIAEGFEKGTNKDLKNFLYISKGSSGEVRSMLYLAMGLGYISKERCDFLYLKSVEISKMLSGFIKSLSKRAL